MADDEIIKRRGQDPIQVRKTAYAQMRVEQLRESMIDSGLVELFVKMGLDGKEYFIDEDGKLIEGEMIPQAERIKMLSAIMTRILPPMKDANTDGNDTGAEKWIEVAKSIEQKQKSPEPSDDSGDSAAD